MAVATAARCVAALVALTSVADAEVTLPTTVVKPTKARAADWGARCSARIDRAGREVSRRFGVRLESDTDKSVEHGRARAIHVELIHGPFQQYVVGVEMRGVGTLNPPKWNRFIETLDGVVDSHVILERSADGRDIQIEIIDDQPRRLRAVERILRRAVDSCIQGAG